MSEIPYPADCKCPAHCITRVCSQCITEIIDERDQLRTQVQALRKNWLTLRQELIRIRGLCIEERGELQKLIQEHAEVEADITEVLKTTEVKL